MDARGNITGEIHGNGLTTTRVYLHKDHLGSITVITDESGAEAEAFSFDAWGKRRAMSLTQLQSILGSWATLTTYQKGNLTIPALTLTSTTTHKGFTGHQQLDGVGLIHMGGRVYDAEIGRFLSADPFVDDSTNLQALNRYSYVQNNPLSYTDPSGYFLKKLVKKIGNAIGNVFEGFGKLIKTGLQKIGRVFAEVPGLSAAITAFTCLTGPWTCAAVQQAMLALNTAITAANGGTITQIFTDLAIGAITSGVPGGGGFWEGGITGEVAKAFGDGIQATIGATMFMGGAIAKAQGGKFIDGVKGAAIGVGVSYGVNRIVNAVREPANDGSPGRQPPDTDIPPEANPNLVAKGSIYEKNGQLNIDITVRNGAPSIGRRLSDNAFNRQLDAIKKDFGSVDVRVSFTIVNSGPADLVFFAGNFSGYRSGSISYTDMGAWRGTSSHEFMHFLTGRGHSLNSSGSIRSYAHDRAVTREDVNLLRGLYAR